MVGFAQTPKFLGTLTLLKIAALFRAEGPWLPEFLEPQKFSLVKLFCPILLIKFYFFCTYLKSSQIISTLPQNPRKSGAPHQTCAPLASLLIFSHSLNFSPNSHNHTPSNRSHKNLVGFAHLNPRKTMSDLHIPHRIRTQFVIAGVFGKIHCRIRTL